MVLEIEKVDFYALSLVFQEANNSFVSKISLIKFSLFLHNLHLMLDK